MNREPSLTRVWHARPLLPFYEYARPCFVYFILAMGTRLFSISTFSYSSTRSVEGKRLPVVTTC